MADINAADHKPGDDTRNESQEARDDRNLGELVQELRVAGLGVQVLFGFLLALPFSARFTKLSTAQRGLYMADLVLAAVTTALQVGPVAYHRLVFRRHQKERLVRVANAMAISGLITVALAVTGAVLLIASFVVPGAAAIVITACVFGVFAGLWIVVPLARRERVNRDRAGAGPDS
jgi:hypothetical protein